MVRSLAAQLHPARVMQEGATTEEERGTRVGGVLAQGARAARAARGPLAPIALIALIALGGTGCVERDPFSASDVAAADAFQASEAAAATRPSAEASRGADRVGCRCDAEGGLHVQAPPGATVNVNERGDDAEAEITLPARRAPGTRLRETVSLGFAGDGKLTETPARESSFYPPERPVGYVGYGYGVGGRAYPVHGRSFTRGSRGSSAQAAGGSASGRSGGNLIFSPHVHSSTMGGVRGSGPSSGRSGGRGHGPR